MKKILTLCLCPFKTPNFVTKEVTKIECSSHRILFWKQIYFLKVSMVDAWMSILIVIFKVQPETSSRYHWVQHRDEFALSLGPT
jgi:hypothetical protein